MIKFIDIQELEHNFNLMNWMFSKKSRRKNAFLAVCYCLNNEVDFEEINELAPFGDLIGPGNSGLDAWFKHFKIFRLHAIFHDAFGFMRSNFSIGPGYVYALTEKPIFANSMLLGHLTGLSYWCYQSFFTKTNIIVQSFSQFQQNPHRCQSLKAYQELLSISLFQVIPFCERRYHQKDQPLF